jgi:hypothetical protein
MALSLIHELCSSLQLQVLLVCCVFTRRCLVTASNAIDPSTSMFMASLLAGCRLSHCSSPAELTGFQLPNSQLCHSPTNQLHYTAPAPLHSTNSFRSFGTDRIENTSPNSLPQISSSCRQATQDSRPVIYFLSEHLRSQYLCNILSDERMGVVYNDCWPSPAQSFSRPSPAGLMTTFYWLRFEAPQPGGPGPRICFPQEQRGPVISLFVASYDSQGYGGGIRPRLHAGLPTALILLHHVAVARTA